MNYADQIWNEQQKVMKTDDKLYERILKKRKTLVKKNWNFR